MIRRPPRSTQSRSSAASDVYKRQKVNGQSHEEPYEIGGHEEVPKCPHLIQRRSQTQRGGLAAASRGFVGVDPVRGAVESPLASDSGKAVGPPGRAIVQKSERIGRLAFGLSLIHISEPTRPY
eukprot:TRINITY_DN11521_c0_g1_i1.p1 TRINITY_DN11521_c0_g1~~TRINITY_DN11521_c0_g1_i1.p1  ORF type:complete len:123 (+),score=42.28 TRINITY_DN11521_c0_g1_i1:140-508(+)